MATTKPIEFDWAACRHGTQEVLLRALERFSSGYKAMSINMPTRYGKTPTGRLLAAISTRGWQTPQGQYYKPFASVNVWVTINLMLREQAADQKHWDKTNEIFGLSESLRYGEIQDGYDSLGKLIRNARPNNEDYLAVNIHKLGDYIDTYCQWIEHLVHTTGLPPIFHFDEAHLLSEAKPWGKIVAAVMEAGARVVTWTATPRRSDGGIIPAFIPETIGEDEREIKVLRDIIEKDDERLGIFDNMQQRITDYTLRANVDIPFSEAWTNGYLLKPSYMTVDVSLSELDGESNDDLRNVMLSDLTPSTLRSNGIIGKAARSRKAIRRAVAIAYEHLMQWRRISPRAALTGFTLSDRDGGKNEHAKIVRDEFLRLNPSLKIAIATQKVDDAHDIIKAFPDSDYDIILFKGMGGVGWDCDRVQVVLDLGDDRQDAQAIQKWMRGGTPYENHKAFSLVLLSDQLNKDIFKRCIQDEGGAASVKVSELIDSELKSLEEHTRNIWIVDNAAQGDFMDSDQFVATSDDAPLAVALMDLVAEFRASATDAALVNRARALGITKSTQAQAEKPIDEQLEEYRTDIIAAMDDALRTIYPSLYPKYDQKTWGDTSQFLYRKMYEDAGLSYDRDYVPVKKNRNLEQLAKLDRHAQIVCEWTKNYAKPNAS